MLHGYRGIGETLWKSCCKKVLPGVSYTLPRNVYRETFERKIPIFFAGQSWKYAPVLASPIIRLQVRNRYIIHV